MTVHSIHRLLDRLGTVANRLPGAHRRMLRRTRAELARYPSIVQADLGWPPVIDGRLPATHIINPDGVN